MVMVMAMDSDNINVSVAGDVGARSLEIVLGIRREYSWGCLWITDSSLTAKVRLEFCWRINSSDYFSTEEWIKFITHPSLYFIIVEHRYNEGQWLANVVHYNEVSLYRGSFPHVLLLMGERKSLVKLRTLFYRVSLYGGSAVSLNNILSMLKL